MKTLIFVLLCAVGGYYIYLRLIYEPPRVVDPPKANVLPKFVPPKPVDFAIKVRVRSLFKEWQRRRIADPPNGSQAIDPEKEFTGIRSRLMQLGSYSAAAVDDAVERALREIGVPEKEIREVASGILAMDRT